MEPGRLTMSRAAVLMLPLLALAACTQDAPEPRPVETEVPEDLRQAAPVRPLTQSEGATPMAERVATIGVLNKRNNLSQDLEMKPGDSRRIGDLIVRLQACERTAPWEFPPQTGGFIQVLVRDAGQNGQWRKVFSGWNFKDSPSLNVVEHPIYDVWVKDCTMSFSGEAPPAEASDSSTRSNSGSGAAAPSPAPAPAPTPTPEAADSNVT